MSLWTLYWLTRLDPLHTFLGASIFATFVIGIAILFFYGLATDFDFTEIEWSNYIKLFKKVFTIGGTIIIFLSLILTLLPTTKEMLAIQAVHFVTTDKRVTDKAGHVINRAEITTDKVFDMIDQYLEGKLTGEKAVETPEKKKK